MRSISCYLSHKRLLAMLTRTLTRTLLGSVLCLTAIEMVGSRYSLARETRSGAEIAQVVPVATSEITGVQISNTENGLAVILESEAMLSAPITSTTGNALILEISDAVLSLPEGDRFQQFSPTEGVALIEVTSLPGNRVRVSITGADAAPTVSLNADSQLPGLQLSVSPGVAVVNGTEEAIQLSVTGEQDEGYAPSIAVSATRTDTPLRDIPQAIQVIPEQVLTDQGVTRIEDALRNAVGVSQQVDRRSPAGSFNIRGFASNGLRNGFEFTQSGNGLQTPIQLPNTIERIEVLRGPDSVLYGAGNPGGTVNYVTKQPLSSPYYAFDITANSNSFYQGSLDLSGPLLSDEANNQQLLYRLTSAYQNFGSFLDFVNGEAVSIAPTLSYEIGEDTRLGLEYEYSAYDQTSYSGLPLDPVIFELPRSRNFDFSGARRDVENQALIFSVDHDFSDAISVQSAFRANFFEADDSGSVNLFDFDADTNEVFVEFQSGETSRDTYSWQNSLTAEFNTGSVEHQLLFGVDWTTERTIDEAIAFNEITLDAFNPDFNQLVDPEEFFSFEGSINTSEVGIYLQDQITLLPNFKLLIGSR